MVESTTTTTPIVGAATTAAAQHSVISVLLCKTLHSVIQLSPLQPHSNIFFTGAGVTVCVCLWLIAFWPAFGFSFLLAFSPRWVSID
jgi:hypothetical protein